MSAESHLAKFEITLQQAKNFIDSNINQSEIIFEAAFNYSVTIPMLSEITKYSDDEIIDYFESAGISHPSSLNNTRKLVNSDLGSLENLVNFNNSSGVLSNALLREKVQPLIGDPNYYPSYDPFFGPGFPFHMWDGKYDSDELGVKHLGEITANIENLESLFYGTLINIFLRLDNSEHEQIKPIIENGSYDQNQALLLQAINSVPSTIIWNEVELADLVINDAARIINEYQISDLPVGGILDNSILGLAML